MSDGITKRKGKEARLEAAIETLLEKLVLHQGKIDWDFVPVEMGALVDALVAFYSGRDFTFGVLEATDFVRHVLGTAVLSGTGVRSVEGELLQSLSPSVLETVRGYLFQQATSLPWPYRVAYPVCRFECCPWHTTWLANYLGRPNEALTPSASQLVSESSFAIALGPQLTLEKVRPGEYDLAGAEQWLWLQAELEGYWTVENRPALIETAAREARSIAGILLACDRLTYSPSARIADRKKLMAEEIPQGMQSMQAQSFAINRHEKKKEWFLDTPENRVVNELRLATELAAVFNVDWEGNLSASEMHAHLAFLQGMFDPARAVLVTDKNGKKRDARMRIRLAAYWYAVSRANSQDPLAAFAFLMLAFEALLGDPNSRERVQGRLADRAAYLIGDSVESRENIAKRILAAYELRSEIFHSGRYDVFLGELEELEKPFKLGINQIFRQCIQRLCGEYGLAALPSIPSNRQEQFH